MTTTNAIVLGVIALIALFAIGVYNGLVGLRQRCKQAFADIDVQLKQRQDLIPNLVETVKGYAKHESETFEKVIKARNAAAGANGPAAQAEAERQLTGALRQLMLLVEAYPDLKANENFKQLQTELRDLENKIAAARRFFNNTAAEYNAKREAFPAIIFASLLGFGPQQFFALDEADRAAASNAPVVKF
ncbi:MAG: LemA family protein [Pseudomonadota bacterium]